MEFFRENIRIAVFSIRTNLMRSLLTMLGIIIGVSSVIAIITIGNGGRDFIVDKVRSMGQNVVSIMVDTSTEATNFITREDIAVIKKIDKVKYVSPSVYDMGQVSTSFTSGVGMALAGNMDFRYLSMFTVEEGRFFSVDEYNGASKVCLIPDVGAKAMFGRTDVIGQYIDYTSMNSGKSVHLRIIGLVEMEMMGMDGDKTSSMLESSGIMGGMASAMTMLIVPSTVTDQLNNSDGRYDTIMIMAKNERYLDDVGNAAENLLCSRHGNAENNPYTVSNMATYIDLMDDIIGILTTFIAGVSAISLVVGGIGVMNIMLVSVTERTREIGIRKALGAKTGQILNQFLTESIILCFIGGVIGFILGVAGAAFVAWFMKIPIAVKPSTVAIAVGFSTGIGLFFGIYPARRAAKMLPIDALRRD